MDLNSQLIRSKRLYARSEAFGATADLENTTLNLETMRVDVTGQADYLGSQAGLSGYYDIDGEDYDLQVDIRKVDLSPFLGDSLRTDIAGLLHARGTGIDPASPTMKACLAMNLTRCVYDRIDASGP